MIMQNETSNNGWTEPKKWQGWVDPKDFYLEDDAAKSKFTVLPPAWRTQNTKQQVVQHTQTQMYVWQ